MRLGQLSRKIAVKPVEIVSYLKETFSHEISSHPNSKVNDEFIDPIIAHFKVDEAKKPIVEPKISEEKEEKSKAEEIEVPKESTLVPGEEETSIQQVKPHQGTSIEEKTENTHKIEETEETEEIEENSEDFYKEEAELNVVDGIIKAPKVEVGGIKVVGKINLPEKSQDVTEDVDEDEDSEGEQRTTSEGVEKEKKQPSREREKSKRKSKTRKIISYEEQKERELLIYEKKREAAEKKRKELKRLNYEKLMIQKSNTAQNTSKKKSKKKTLSTGSDKAKKSAPKTLWGKFIRWLNT